MVLAIKHYLPTVQWAIVRQWIVVALCSVALVAAVAAHANHGTGSAGAQTQHATTLPDDSDSQDPDVGDSTVSHCTHDSCSSWMLVHREAAISQMLAAKPELNTGANINGRAAAPLFHPPKV
jgi:hypothetical protein